MLEPFIDRQADKKAIRGSGLLCAARVGVAKQLSPFVATASAEGLFEIVMVADVEIDPGVVGDENRSAGRKGIADAHRPRCEQGRRDEQANTQPGSSRSLMSL